MRVRAFAVAFGSGLLALLPALALAQTPRSALKICQDPNNLPFANAAGQGFENRIAELMGQAMNLPVTYYNFPNRLAFVRNTLRYKLPDEDYPCDLILGVPQGFDQVATTQPYYRSSFVALLPKGAPWDSVHNSAELAGLLQDASQANLRIGVMDRSPASTWLGKHGLDKLGVPYQLMNPNADQAPWLPLTQDLQANKLNLAILWGPIAAQVVQQDGRFRVLPMVSENGVKFDFSIAMGLRYGEPAWKQEVQAALDAEQEAIKQVLTQAGVPLLPLVSASAVAPSKP